MSEYGDEIIEVREGGLDWTGGGNSLQMSGEVKQKKNFLTINGSIALLSLIGTCFLPWVRYRLPGLTSAELSFVELSGGKIYAGFFVVFALLGVLLASLKQRLGVLIICFSVGMVGWLAGMAALIIGIVRSLIPAIPIPGVDISRSLLGQGSGVVLAIFASILVSVEILGHAKSDRNPSDREFNLMAIISLLLTVGLSVLNHTEWLVVSSSKFSDLIAISGDNIFGSVVVAVITWCCVAVAAGELIGVNRITTRVVSFALLICGIVKLLQAVVVWGGASLFKFLIPNSIGEFADPQMKLSFWLSLVVALVCVVLGILGITRESFLESVAPTTLLRSIPTAALAIVVVAGLITANIDSGASGTSSGSSTSSNDSATLLIRSTVQIVVSDGVSGCWSGSGTFIGDGTRVLTNAHVAVGESGDSPTCNQIQIGITTKASAEPSEFFTATIESVDKDHDLAVLAIEGVKAGQYPVLKVRSEELSIDEPIRVIGYPGLGGNTITLTNGVIAGFDDRFDGQYYKVSASISSGNSGGPMVDKDGRLVGIATAVVLASIDCSPNCTSEGSNLGLVRPISFALSLIEKKG